MIVVISQVIVLVFGATIAVAAAWGFFAPNKLMTFVSSTMDQPWGIVVAVVARLVLGAALIGVAPASAFPIVFQVLGALAIVAAVALAIAGRERVRRFMNWWIERFSASINRAWLLIGAAFGAFLVYGVLLAE